jgi:hypothetical protein
VSYFVACMICPSNSVQRQRFTLCSPQVLNMFVYGVWRFERTLRHSSMLMPKASISMPGTNQCHTGEDTFVEARNSNIGG